MTELAQHIRAGARGRRLRPTKANTELGRTATALDEMLDALESAEAKAQAAEARMRLLLADVSHDLRTPIAGAIASAEQLLRSDRGRVDREARLVDVVRESQRAARLVDDLLLMARLEDADPSELLANAELDLNALIVDVVDAFRAVNPSLRLELELDGAAWVHGNADRLTRVLRNLLENARNAGGPGATIDVSVHTVAPAEARRGGRGSVTVDVRDNGPGVPAWESERIFDRFARLDHSRTSPGSGLGLPIARAIARGLDGDVRCLPGVRGGHFQLILPTRQLMPAVVCS